MQKTISDILSISPRENVPWMSLPATATSIDLHDFYFLACPLMIDGMQCMKKAIRQDDTTWHCSKCDGSFTKCDYRYILCLQLHDHTDHLENVVAFDEAANGLLGISAEDLFLLSIDPQVVLDIYSKIKGRQLLFTLSLKSDTFNGVE